MRAAATRRLAEELGVDCALASIGTFVYRAVCESTGLVEHELDHVLLGILGPGVELAPDPCEVSAWRWADPAEVLEPARAPDGPRRASLAPWLAPALLLAERSRHRLAPPPGTGRPVSS